MPEFDARIEAAKLKSLYDSDSGQKTFKVLLTGDKGTGKTQILSTAVKPVHIDSFDPGGTKPLRDLISQGSIIADTRYETEDPLNPSMFSLWKNNFEHKLRNKYFDNFGTYCLDSSTMWNEAIMNYVLKGTGKSVSRAGEAPVWQKDYTPQKTLINNYMHKILSLPCNVIVTGHLAPIYESKIILDEEVKVLSGWRYMTTGQGSVIIPLLFDELYVTKTNQRSTGLDYKLLTVRSGLYVASTRIGKGVFKPEEEPDIKGLLRKANLPFTDKPTLIDKNSEELLKKLDLDSLEDEISIEDKEVDVMQT